MKDADKNRDPERARKRARSDARCALRKLGLLEGLEALAKTERNGDLFDNTLPCYHYVLDLVSKLLDD